MLNLGKKAYESAIASRRTWNEVFGTKQGKAVFTAILNRLGFFSVIPEKVKPENMVVANWMLNQMGVLTVDNLSDYVEKIVSAADNKDLHLIDIDSPNKEEKED